MYCLISPTVVRRRCLCTQRSRRDRCGSPRCSDSIAPSLQVRNPIAVLIIGPVPAVRMMRSAAFSVAVTPSLSGAWRCTVVSPGRVVSSVKPGSLLYGSGWMGRRVLTVQGRGLHGTVTRMKLNSAIVGLPNVGKSTLFNALVENGNAQAANFPFCTIEPNVGMAEVPDGRLDKLASLNESERVIPACLEVVDVAGLVKGAAEGEGLGNKFLGNIRECDAIVHVVRCFEDEDVVHVSGAVDAIRDIEVINLELMLADLAQVEKRLGKVKGKSGRKPKGSEAAAAEEEMRALEKLLAGLNEGVGGKQAGLSAEEEEAVRGLGLLTMKPVVYAANVGEAELSGGNAHVERVQKYACERGEGCVVVSAQVESELMGLDRGERIEFLEGMGVSEDEMGLRALVKEAYRVLGLQTYFTSGPKETRAWTIRRGVKAAEAAGVIHEDFERGFIRAETIGFETLVEVGGEKVAKEKGLMRSEGKEYVVKDGDVMLFRFNV